MKETYEVAKSIYANKNNVVQALRDSEEKQIAAFLIGAKVVNDGEEDKPDADIEVCGMCAEGVILKAIGFVEKKFELTRSMLLFDYAYVYPTVDTFRSTPVTVNAFRLEKGKNWYFRTAPCPPVRYGLIPEKYKDRMDRSYSNFDKDDLITIHELNDLHRFSFKEIADIIEAAMVNPDEISSVDKKIYALYDEN